jgi:hypothetical protein
MGGSMPDTWPVASAPLPVVSYRVLIILLMVGFLALLVGSIPAAVALARQKSR